MINCNNNVVIPDLPEDECDGKRIKTTCVYSPTSITLLNLPTNSSLETILNAMVLALNANNTRLNAQDIIIEDLEQRIIDLES